MVSHKVPLTRPYITSADVKAVSSVLASGWLTQGPRVAEFEQAVARYVGMEHAVACSNCTCALHIGLLLHGIGPGDEVVVPSYTWIATANAVRMVGATPRFADIDLATFNITKETVAAAITPRTRAIIPVDQFGMPVDFEEMAALASDYRLVIIQDAACAFGSEYKGRPVGNQSEMTCFSFHPRKVITTGEGGALVTRRSELANRARVLINHGSSTSDTDKHRAAAVGGLRETFEEAGYNYRLTDLQAALGLAQLAHLPEILRLRRQRAQRYAEALCDLEWVIPPQVPAYASPNWQSYAIRVADDAPVSMKEVAARLLEAGVACRPGYVACHLQPLYRRIFPDLRLPNTERALTSVLILPLYPQMTDQEQDYVIDHLRDAVQDRR